jgi:Tol biopolymer transport system component
VIPDFSPGGGRILFGAGRRTNSQIKVMRAGGGHQRRLTDDDSAYNFFADFSPSGKSIVFVHLGASSEGLFKMSADGGHRIRLAGPRLEPSAPDWGVRP